MTYGITRRNARYLVLLAGLLAMVILSLALSAPRAAASPFCGGQVRSNYAYCYGAARAMSGDFGYGVERSICIGASIIWGGCAPANTLKQMNLGAVYVVEPWIEVNAAGSTVLYGETF